jgi:phosphonate transport system substrate-binding protein
VARWRALLSCALTALVAAPLHAADAPAAYTLAVVPYQLPLTLHRDWTPLARRLAARLGTPVELKVYPAFPEFEADLLQRGAPDFAFVNPYHQVLAKKRHGYLPLVRSRTATTGVLVVRDDSPVRHVRELDGQTIGFPSPNAFGASLHIRAHLNERIGFQPRYLGSHSEVYRHVLLGEVAAGGGIRYTLEREPPELRRRLRVLYETEANVAHALAAHPRVSPAAREALRALVLELDRSADTRALLAPLQLADPVAADYARDYGPLERLGLERYGASAR